MKPVNLNRLAYFKAVADFGSFTRAAESLDITKGVISQQVTKLEAELKTSLFHRSTRRVEVTDTGKLLLARCAFIMREAEDAFHELAQANEQPMGLLRISAPNDYGTSAVASATVRRPVHHHGMIAFGFSHKCHLLYPFNACFHRVLPLSQMATDFT